MAALFFNYELEITNYEKGKKTVQQLNIIKYEKVLFSSDNPFADATGSAEWHCDFQFFRIRQYNYA
jgi:hypothetical protein